MRCKLAAEIVSTTYCAYCGAQPEVRCLTQAGSTHRLPPSASHRLRINKYWDNEKKAGRYP